MNGVVTIVLASESGQILSALTTLWYGNCLGFGGVPEIMCPMVLLYFRLLQVLYTRP
jgi:hypothetical protein